jgi:hypothetical protein
MSLAVALGVARTTPRPTGQRAFRSETPHDPGRAPERPSMNPVGSTMSKRPATCESPTARSSAPSAGDDAQLHDTHGFRSHGRFLLSRRRTYRSHAAGLPTMRPSHAPPVPDCMARAVSPASSRTWAFAEHACCATHPSSSPATYSATVPRRHGHDPCARASAQQ